MSGAWPGAGAEHDDYARYYTEKLWSWIPEVYRDEDGRLATPGALRAFVEAFAAEAAGQRRSIDRLWDDTMVAYADDWAVPYIGALVGTRMLSGLNPRGRRLDVAKTVAYRRRAGTPYVLEELIHDIAGWHGAVVEGYLRLARTRHNYDPEARALPGHFDTPRGGTANLRRAADGERVDGPFDRYAHLADLRAGPMRAGGDLGSPRGLYNVPKLTLHVYRRRAYRVEGATPVRLDSRRFVIDPSGRDRALFARGARLFSKTSSVARIEASGAGWTRGPESSLETVENGWAPAQEWQMPAPLGCRLFNEAAYAPQAGQLGPAAPPAFDALFGQRYETTAALRGHYLRLAGGAPDWPAFVELLGRSVTREAPKKRLYGEDGSLDLALGSDPAASPLAYAHVAAADLSGWGEPGGAARLPEVPPEVRLLVDPATGRLAASAPVDSDTRLAVPLHHVGGFDDVGAGSYPRPGLAEGGVALPFAVPPAPGTAGTVDAAALQAMLNAAGERLVAEVGTSATLRLSADGLTLPHTVMQAADGTRPYLRIEPTGGGRAFTLTAAAPAAGAPPPDVTLDGLWIGLRPAADDSLDQPLGAPDEPVTPDVFSLVLDGDFGEVRLSRVTLDPGGEAARTDPLVGRPIPAVRLEIRGSVDRLVVDRAILGPILETVGGQTCSVRSIEISDSIVVAGDPDAPAIETVLSAVALVRSTVLGDVRVNRLDASETIVTGFVEVADNQNGCFRFSAARAGVSDPLDPRYERLPRQYRSQRLPGDFARATFVSQTFGHSGFCQLGPGADPHLARGAENGGELGAFHRALAPIRLRDLMTKIDEYKPIHLVGQVVLET